MTNQKKKIIKTLRCVVIEEKLKGGNFYSIGVKQVKLTFKGLKPIKFAMRCFVIMVTTRGYNTKMVSPTHGQLTDIDMLIMKQAANPIMNCFDKTSILRPLPAKLEVLLHV